MNNNNNNNNNNSNNRKMRRTRESAVPSPSTAIGGTPSNHSSSSRNNNSSNTHDMHSIHLNTDRLSQKRVMHSSSKIQHQQNRTPQISLSSAYDSYSIRGDTRSAYRMFTDVMTSSVTEAAPEETASTNISTVGGSTNVNPSATTTSSATIRYNHFILSELRTNESSDRNPTPTPKSASEVLQQLKDLESNLLTEYSISESSINTTTTTTATTSTTTMTTTEITSSKERIDAYYCTYNRALIYYGISDYITSLQLCMESIRPHIQQHSSSSSQQNGSGSTTGSNKPQKSNRDSTEPKMEPVPIILFHLVFLLLECLLALGVGRKHHSGWNHLLQIHLDQPTTNIITIEMILDWLDEAMITLAEDTDDTTSTNHPPTAQQQQPNTAFVEPSQIKFLIPLYKSRIALSESDGTKIEQATRLARKDMKTAMEIFHNKLRPSMTTMQQQQQQTNHHLNIHATATTTTTAHHETDSVASSINSMDDRSPPPVIPNNTMDAVLPSPSPSSSLFSTSSPLTKYNQSALCVKAQLEQLKGNTKKSLILCTEAALGSTTNSTTGNLKPNLVSASTDTSTTTSLVTDDVIPSSPAQTTTSWYDAIHANNLAIIYATNDRKHLALHGMVKALRANTAMMLHDNSNSPTEALKASFSNVFLPDGTVKSDISTSLLYNTAICCLRTRNYLSAYECMVSCICHNYSRVFHNCTRCYMYLSDACLGIYAQQTKEQHVVSPHQQHPIRALVEVDGVPKGVVLDNQAFRSELALAKQEKLAILGSTEDIAQVQRNPLLRARFCLQYVLQTMDNPLERDVIVSARLSMCYVELAFGNYYKVREMANAILSEMEGIVLNDDHQSQSIQRLHKRQVATVSLYLSEACCALGDVSTAMMHVLDEGGTDGKLNQLVSHLSGVTVEQASKSKSAQRRLLDANAKVRSCAAVITAATGNTGTAKELLQSVKITDDEHHAQVDSLSTRRALTYTFLRDRDTATALATLS